MSTLIKRYSPPLHIETIKTAVPVTGGGVDQTLNQVNQLAGVKILGSTHCNVISDQLTAAYVSDDPVDRGRYIVNSSSAEDHRIFISTSGLSTHLAYVLKFSAVGYSATHPSISASLFDFSNTLIDIGCVFTAPQHIEQNGAESTSTLQQTFSGFELYDPPSGGYGAPTQPRPLYIPLANRGDVLILRLTTSGAVMVSVDIMEVI